MVHDSSSRCPSVRRRHLVTHEVRRMRRVGVHKSTCQRPLNVSGVRWGERLQNGAILRRVSLGRQTSQLDQSVNQSINQRFRRQNGVHLVANRRQEYTSQLLRTRTKPSPSRRTKRTRVLRRILFSAVRTHAERL